MIAEAGKKAKLANAAELEATVRELGELQEAFKPINVVRDPVVMEFLGPP